MAPETHPSIHGPSSFPQPGPAPAGRRRSLLPRSGHRAVPGRREGEEQGLGSGAQKVSWLRDPPEQKSFRTTWSGKSFAWKKQNKIHSVFSFRRSPASPSMPAEVFLGVPAGRGTSWTRGAAQGRGTGWCRAGSPLPGRAALRETRSLRQRGQPWHSRGCCGEAWAEGPTRAGHLRKQVTASRHGGQPRTQAAGKGESPRSA